MSFPTHQVVCQLLRSGPPKRNDKILLKFMDCTFQSNSDDCGLYTIANAIAEAFGIDPITQEYNTEFMRGHLINCFQQSQMSPFPARTRKSTFADGVRYSPDHKVFCTCQMPEDGQYAICEKCNIWYHPKCEGLSESDIPADDVPWFCKKKKKKKKNV